MALAWRFGQKKKPSIDFQERFQKPPAQTLFPFPLPSRGKSIAVLYVDLRGRRVRKSNCPSIRRIFIATLPTSATPHDSNICSAAPPPLTSSVLSSSGHSNFRPLVSRALHVA